MKREDLTGRRFGHLTVISYAESKNSRRYWNCICDCGNKTIVLTSHLTSGYTTSCGCAKGLNFIDISGQRFGRLVALKPTDKRLGNSIIWECACDCGNTCEVPSISLRQGLTKSCGCLAKIAHSKSVKVANKIRKEYRTEGTDIIAITRKSPLKNNTSGCTGVSYDKSVGLWKATINFQREKYYLGGYSDKNAAILARKAAEKEIYGKFTEWYAEEYPQIWKKIKGGK